MKYVARTKPVLKNRTKRVVGAVGRALVGAMVIAAVAFYSFKAKAEELDQAKQGEEPREPAIERSITFYLQDGLNRGLEAAAVGSAAVPIGPLTVSSGFGVSGELGNTDRLFFEHASLSLSGGTGTVGGTAYGSMDRSFPDSRNATGGEVAVKVSQAGTVFAGAEYEFVRNGGGRIPVFVGGSTKFGRLSLTGVAVSPLNAPDAEGTETHPNLGGALSAAVDVGDAKLVLQGFVMTDTQTRKALAANVGAGVTVPF